MVNGTYLNDPPPPDQHSHEYPDRGTVSLAFTDRTIHVELGRLTPRARAFAEVYAEQLGGQVGGAIVLESVCAQRDLVPTEDVDRYPDELLNRPVTMLWRSWSPWRSHHSPNQDIVWWLEYEAAQIPAEFVAVRPQHADGSWRAPSADLAHAEPLLLSRNKSLALLRRLGCHADSEAWLQAQRDALVPGPVYHLVGQPFWRPIDVITAAAVLGTELAAQPAVGASAHPDVQSGT